MQTENVVVGRWDQTRRFVTKQKLRCTLGVACDDISHIEIIQKFYVKILSLLRLNGSSATRH